MSKTTTFITKFTLNEKLVIDCLCKAERLKKSTYLNRIIENELETYDEKYPTGYFIPYRQPKNSLKLSEEVSVGIAFKEETHRKLEEICNKTDWTKQYLVRVLILPTLLFYEEDGNLL